MEIVRGLGLSVRKIGVKKKSGIDQELDGEKRHTSSV